MLKILIADDEAKERNGIERLLKEGGFDFAVTKAVNGEDALHKVEKEHFDVLLTDIKMPFLNGIQLIEAVQKLERNMVFIIHSAYGEFEYAQSAISLGVLKYLLKPIDVGEFGVLFREVEQLCRKIEHEESQRHQLEEDRAAARHFRMERQLLSLLEQEGDAHEALLQQILSAMPEYGQACVTPVLVCDRQGTLPLYWDVLLSKVDTAFGKDAFCLIHDETQALVLLFQARKTRDTARLETVYKTITNSMRQQCRLDLMVVAGRTLPGLAELKFEYDILNRQQEYQFFLSGSAVFFHDRDYIFSSDQDMMPLMLDRVYNSLSVGNLSEARGELEKVFIQVEENIGFSPIYIKYIFTEALKQIRHIMGQDIRLPEVVEKIHTARSFDEIKKQMRLAMGALLHGEDESPAENRVVKMARELVYRHYAEADMGLSYLAEKLEVTPAYLSSLFKKDTGQNLVKFITEYRLEKAKQALRESNMKISDVGARVGYPNQSYFISLFRSREGTSPAQYRERKYVEK